ncbi:hypothetical protein Tco_0231384 [Tanacetum coccineum]
MTSFDYRLNPIYAIKECSSCGSLYTSNCGCSKGSLEDKILVPKPPRNCVRCARCGTPVDGPYCQGCALLRKEFMEGLFTNCVENEFFKDFQDTSESSDDNTNVVNAPREPIVVNQDPGENSSPSPPHIDHCCHECGDSLDGIFCRQCTCKSCGKGAHYGYNCPPKVPIISNPEPCKNQTIDEPLQNLQSLQQQCLLVIQKKEEEKQIAEEQAAKDRYWKIPICYDDDEDNTTAITPVLPIRGVLNSSKYGDEIFESEGYSDKMCDVPLCENTTPLNALNEHSEIVAFLTMINPSMMTILPMMKTSIMSMQSPPYMRSSAKISSGSPTTHSDYSLPDYEAFYSNDDHIEEKSSGSTTTQAESISMIRSSLIFRSIHFLLPIGIEPELGNLTMDVVNDIFPTREPRVHVPNVLPTHPTQDTDFILLSEPLFAYIVWIFLPFLTYGYQEKNNNKDKTGQIRARDKKEREKTSPAVPSDFIGPARNPLNGPDQPYMIQQSQIQAYDLSISKESRGSKTVAG